ncbi:phenylalanyl-tRNA synthetase subunit beta [Thermosipho melanesiensis]|uniref:Phenylalanine--tRNA ligase beta subunit n=2 Tax=Thermosipho melanesiensis TaxID=46541 RepID=A6LL69_THEM4|nr:phenylalanine--tRNA ligase subunit beta [Thermosipho melanesiensis]ABR30670.1 phenylalanyl-tRNA synthetase, beta subunit [Thermosipho melanesiensis BI429]APT73802.1 phenylalanyl-tRNA synthetase subunit beta [Thermosipho melanesiensis]OOC35741.1 phenylalanyl-tRNA synthetase subunit beta [Thermosipho melanesiensis]OOC39040.1 phenylalanyl-tRNA synthetase subunit beta [Thermosipho melanesiensis]OOC39188.1 phenylalanyl-tRNA synthetase subunit beta [Thermosipho melanesiensis]
MKLSFEWLKDFVNIDKTAEEVAEKLSLTGTNVEEIINPFDVDGKIVVGKVLEIEKHPNADRLIVCKVDIGNEVRTIVTGDLSVSKDDLVPLALENTRLGKLIIKPRKMRGILSEGMLCSLQELGLEEKSSGVYKFKDDVPVGTDVIEYFKLRDKVLDIEITPNRSDCLSVLGIAREVSAIYDVDLNLKEKEINSKDEHNIEIRIESDGCYRYTSRIIKGVKIKESPMWLQKRLIASGIRPINNIVDITNYVMLEMGHPVHAFDLRNTPKIVVKDAKGGEEILLLDGKTYKLMGNEVLITDGEKILALGGIMGGEESGVKEDTTEILLEVAMFDPVRIRKASKYHGIITDSSYRFERGMDPNDSLRVINRLTELVLELAGGIPSEIKDVVNKKIESTIIDFDFSMTKKIIGIEIPKERQIKILNRLGFEVNENKVKVPTFRYFDITRSIDLVEEISRIYGMENINGEPFKITTNSNSRSKEQKLRYMLKDALKNEGFLEAMNLSFVSRKWSINGQKVKISNPINEELSVMRPSLLNGLLESLAYNYKRQIRDIKLFEVGKVFMEKDGKPFDVEKVAAVATGKLNKNDYTDPRKIDFYTFKGMVENVLNEFNISASFIPHNLEGFVPTRLAKIIVNNEEVGIIGMFDPDFMDKYFDVKDEVYAFELSTDFVYENFVEIPEYKESAQFPSVRRDVSILVPDNFLLGDVINSLFKYQYVEEVGISDIYKGKGIEKGYKSITIYCVFRAKDRTLKEEEVNKIWEKIKKDLVYKYPLKLRFEEV